MNRGLFVASSLSAALLGGCSALKTNLTSSLAPVLHSAEGFNHAVLGTRGMAKEYQDADVDRDFRTNGLNTPTDQPYANLVAGNFRDYKLPVTGLIVNKHVFSLAELRALPRHTQITRHDCVEGWSAIGKWAGVPLATVLAMAKPQANARYVVFRCFDKDDSGTQFYGSLDLHQAAHPQTLLALDLNDKPMDADHGGPVRLRVPTQLGYKSTKWIRAIEIADKLPGNGGYWEDQGYEWYAGI